MYQEKINLFREELEKTLRGIQANVASQPRFHRFRFAQNLVQSLKGRFDRLFPEEMWDRSIEHRDILDLVDKYCSKKISECPICRSKMIERNGKFGAFYGCSKYPSCHGSRKTNGQPGLSPALKEHLKGYNK